MKRLLLILAAVFLFAAPCHADDIRAVTEPYDVMVTQVLSLSADATDASFNADLAGRYLYQVEIVTSLDDAVTFTINSALGTQLFTTTTTTATDGEVSTPTTFYTITKNRTPTYTLSGLGSGTATIEVTFIGK